MKKLWCYFATSLLAVVAAGCAQKQNPDDKPGGEVEPQGPRTITLTASLEDISNGKMVWLEGDRIAVLQSDGVVVPFTLSSGAGTGSAVFTGEIDSAASAVWAGYPYWDGAWSEDGFSVPSFAVDWKGNEGLLAVMKGEISDDSVSFTHQGAVLHFKIKDVPSGARQLKFTASGNAVYGKDTFVLGFTPISGTMEFYVPVSAGIIPSYTVSLCDTAGNPIIFQNFSSATVERCELQDQTQLQVIESNKIRIIAYNVQDGMSADMDKNYNNLVAWINSMAPDILVLCEAKNSEITLNTLASRWGHSYTAIVDRDSYPVVVTSSRPMSTVIVVNNSKFVSHGAVYVSVAGLNLVGLHLRPTQDKGTELPNKYEYYGALRVAELNYILDQTILSDAYSSNTDWVFLGDYNMLAYSERNASSPLGGAVYYYPDYDGQRSVAYNVYDNMCATGLKDVLYNFNGGIFQPTMYHGRSRLDYIFASPSVYSRVRSATVVRGGFPGNYNSGENSNPSDHLPLVMDLSDYSFKLLDGITHLGNMEEENLFSEYLD